MSDSQRATVSGPEHTLRVQQLFVQHQGRLRAFLLALEPDFAVADDLLQETFLTVSHKAAEFEPGSNFYAWARRIALFKLLAQGRDRRRGPVLLASDVVEGLAAAEPDFDEAQHETEIAALKDCLGRLAPAARELVHLRYWGERLPEEIAQLRAQSVNAVNVTLSRARVALRECLERRTPWGGRAV